MYSGDARYSGDDAYCEHCDFPDNSEFQVTEHYIDFVKAVSPSFRENRFRTFCGVEIETLNDGLCESELSRAECMAHQFNQHYDGSLGECGAEFSSNPANGDLLFNRIRALCRLLEDRGFYVNRDCGLHIHIEASRRLPYLKKVFAFYKKYESLFFQMLPQSRQNNQYCRKFDNIYAQLKTGEVFKMNQGLEFTEKLYDVKGRTRVRRCRTSHSHDKRYGWVNFHSLFYRGTLEIRAHSGTLNGQKIINWLKIHLTCLNLVKKLPLEVIKRLPDDKAGFLSFFDSKLQDYIKQRWDKFAESAGEVDETDLNTSPDASPVPEQAQEAA
jgi:hypothetical protein